MSWNLVFGACQDDLADMTQRKDALAEALESALEQLTDIQGMVAVTALDKVYHNNA